MIPENEKTAGYEPAAEESAELQNAQKKPKLQAKNLLFSTALGYSRRGFAIFPVQGKIPLTGHGCKDASKIDLAINRWWQQWPTANIGIATGNISGIWVLDVDGEEGEISLRELENKHGALPETVQAITGGGGRHLYFSMPSDIKIPNSVKTLGAGLDVRSDGGYVVAPPSLHASGKRYCWSVDSASSIASAPDWLLTLVTSAKKQNSAQSNADWAALLQGVREGSRNDALAKLTGKLLAHRLPTQISLYLIMAWNDARCTPPLDKAELLRTFTSIAQIEAKKRGII